MYESKLSSGYLFHYTNSLDTLISIIENGFYPRCAIEDVHFALPGLTNEQSKMGIPMVCFCDIPLALSAFHRSQYGQYGIALSKEWGIKHGIAPVHYVIENSANNNAFINLERFIQHIIDNYENLCHKTNTPFDKDELTIETVKIMFELLGNYKQYSDDNMTKLYYDEREWRYLVPFYEDNSQEISNRLSYNELNDNRVKIFNDEMAKRYKLTFNIDDICQIILPCQKDIDVLCNKFSINKDIVQVVK